MSKRFYVEYDNEFERGFLFDGRTGKEIACDGGEPQDATFARDWSWVVIELNKLDDEINELRAAK